MIGRVRYATQRLEECEMGKHRRRRALPRGTSFLGPAASCRVQGTCIPRVRVRVLSLPHFSLGDLNERLGDVARLGNHGHTREVHLGRLARQTRPPRG